MIHFSVTGPLAIPFQQGKASKIVSSAEAASFWEEHPSLADRRGCYVFAIRAGRGITPAYVGRATKTFRQEVFARDKIAKYQHVLAEYRRGTPVIFLLAAPQGRGKPNVSIVRELESFLIQSALSVNADLVNVHGTKRAQFSIAGVLRGGKGKPSHAARIFKTSMAL